MILFVADVALIEIIAVERRGHGGQVHERDAALERDRRFRRAQSSGSSRTRPCSLELRNRSAMACPRISAVSVLVAERVLLSTLMPPAAEVALEDQAIVPVHQDAGGVGIAGSDFCGRQ
jgi:hypothetical protein